MVTLDMTEKNANNKRCNTENRPSLVEVDDEDNVVTETRQPVSGRHGDDERKHIVDKSVKCLSHTHTHNHFTAFWTLSGTTLVSRYQKVHFAIFWIFWSKMKITQADTPTIWMDCHPIQTYWCPTLPSPPFLRRMLVLTQPSQFILAWDRHQICWLAYPVAWLNACYMQIITTTQH